MTLKTSPQLTISPATSSDFEGIWTIFRQVVAAGDTYPHPPETTRQEAEAYWMADSMKTYVARKAFSGDIVGVYYLRANQPGLGSHVANGGYMVSPAVRGQGIGRLLGLHSIETATALGFRALQFNLVVATNTASVNLWRSLGFSIIGTVPEAFRHLEEGYVDAYIMYRLL
jgi:L-amino acid N-acyltransferase YncA